MPLSRKAIVIDPVRRAKGLPAVGATHKHHIGGASPGRQHAGQHVDVIVSRAAGVINRQEQLPAKPYSIYPTLNDGATQVNTSVLVKSRCLASVLRVARAHAAKYAPVCPTTNKKIAVGIYIERTPYWRIGNCDRRLPGHPAVSRALEFHAPAATVSTIV